MKPKIKRPFYGNQHQTLDQRIDRKIADERKAVRGPTNRQQYMARVARGEAVPPSPLLAEIGEKNHAAKVQGADAIPVCDRPAHSAEVGGTYQVDQGSAGDGATAPSQEQNQ